MKNFRHNQLLAAVKELEEKAVMIKDIRFLSGRSEPDSADILKNIAFQVRNSSDNTVLVLDR